MFRLDGCEVKGIYAETGTGSIPKVRCNGGKGVENSQIREGLKEDFMPLQEDARTRDVGRMAKVADKVVCGIG